MANRHNSFRRPTLRFGRIPLLSSSICNRNQFWVMYLVSLWLRAYLGFRNRSLQPLDQFDQFTFLLEDFFDIPTDSSFKTKCQSKVLYYLVSWPLYLYQRLGRFFQASPPPSFLYLRKALRFSTVVHSLLIDLCIFKLAGSQKRYNRGLILLWSTSYMNLVYFTQPLAENVVAVLVAVLLVLTVSAYWVPRRSTETINLYLARTNLVGIPWCSIRTCV